MDRFLSKNNLIILAFVLGFIFGLFVFGWNITPPRFTDAGPEHMASWHLDNYVAGLASTFNATGNGDNVKNALCYNDSRAAVESRLNAVINDGDDIKQNIYSTILDVTRADGGCDAYRAKNPAVTTGSSSLLLNLCLLGLLIGAVLLGLFFLLNRRPSEPAEKVVREVKKPLERPAATRRRKVVEEPETTVAAAAPLPPEPEYIPEPPPPAPAPIPRTRAVKPAAKAAPAGGPTPLAGFQSTYTRGDEAFDKSFIIENGNGDFLGECGVSISETITASDNSRNATAFEIWLFDKNDTHTVTKVIMSDHAYNDEALRAKLATRGEPVRAQYDETIVLETASLIINAEVTDIDYSTLAPDSSTFDRFTVDLSAWVKAISNNPNGPDEMLDF